MDAVAGVADPATGRPVTRDTLFRSACTGKAVTSTVAHVLVERGVFGMVGRGGSAAWADRATGISVAVTRNRFNPVDMTAVERVWDLLRETYG
ncbi:hypothetical protein AWW66_24495 [Micromonospora rosaria]|uniref:Beta-lactamase-related domain-containing protein n=1 Tax=Micromonospora rosaria TaxID=47874 RepID=A0A136PM50_9ACTN|nr:hypothetical protein AWW66_24495 [Micromonospora rosaria]